MEQPWQQQHGEIIQQIAVELIRLLPPHWNQAALHLVASGGLGHGVSHSITNLDGLADAVFPRDPLFYQTRRLELFSIEHNQLWKRVEITVARDGENWKMDSSFTYDA